MRYANSICIKEFSEEQNENNLYEDIPLWLFTYSMVVLREELFSTLHGRLWIHIDRTRIDIWISVKKLLKKKKKKRGLHFLGAIRIMPV